MLHPPATIPPTAADPTVAQGRSARREPLIALPATRLTVVTIAACLAAAGISIVLGKLGLHDGPAGLSLAAAGIVAAATLGGLIVMVPWRARPIGLWPSFWLGSTVFRLLVTPVLAYLLYSATQLSAAALALHVVCTYVLALVGEVVVLAGFLKRALP